MKLIRISSTWCVSCIVTDKIWKELKNEYPYQFTDYDYDIDEEELKQYEIGNILPVIIILKENKEITRIIGEKSKSEIKKIIDSIEV